MRQHRFAFNFGYGFDSNSEAMVGATFLVTSVFLELGLELVVDGAAMDIEQRHGIDVDKFWEMWRKNPVNFFAFHVTGSLLALGAAFWAFSNLPTPVFCVSQHDPCSCVGGGFDIFTPLCIAAAADAEMKDGRNKTNSSSNYTESHSSPENTYVDGTQRHSISLPVIRLRV